MRTVCCLHLGAYDVCGWVTLVSYPEQELIHAQLRTDHRSSYLSCPAVSYLGKPGTERITLACFLTDMAFVIGV